MNRMQQNLGRKLDTFCIPIKKRTNIKLKEVETVWFFLINQWAFYYYGHGVQYDVSIG
jgi:hypothetical protein